MHALYNLDNVSTYHFANTTVKTFTNFWKFHFSIYINGEIVKKLSNKTLQIV